MNDLIQTIQVLTPEEVKFVNAELDKKEFTVSSIGFDDGECPNIIFYPMNRMWYKSIPFVLYIFLLLDSNFPCPGA